MTITPQLDAVLELALQLAPGDRLRLVEHVVISVERDIASSAPTGQLNTEEHWGKSLNQLLDAIGPIEMLYPEIEDPVEWVKHLRAEQRRRRLGD